MVALGAVDPDRGGAVDEDIEDGDVLDDGDADGEFGDGDVAGEDAGRGLGDVLWVGEGDGLAGSAEGGLGDGVVLLGKVLVMRSCGDGRGCSVDLPLG